MAEVTVGKTQVTIKKRVTVSYPWDETAPTSQNGKVRIFVINLVYEWQNDHWEYPNPEWTLHANGARIKKDGSAYNERMVVYRLDDKSELFRLIELYRPTTIIEYSEVENG